jgi:hypothetical protein
MWIRTQIVKEDIKKGESVKKREANQVKQSKVIEKMLLAYTGTSKFKRD